MRPVELPRDERAHLWPFEWWYFVGHLETVDSGPARELAFETTVVRAGTGYVAVFALIDVLAKSYRTWDRVTPWPLVYRDDGDGFQFVFRPSTSGTFDVRESIRAWLAGETWRIAREATGRYRIVLAQEREGLDLALLPTKPAALLGDRGVVRYGTKETLAYYVRSRLDAQGTATLDGVRRAVRGRAWMDRQWGAARVWRYRWKFLAVQLDDGTDVVAFRVHDARDGSLVHVYGAIVDAAGTMRALDATEVTIADRTPTFRHGTIEYPTRTRLEVASAGLAIDVEPYVEDQRRRTRNVWQPLPVWWEGACSVSGTFGGAPVTGKAFTELAGYEPFVALPGR
ncbi:MAG: hypothetical protein IT379_09395 [Deltaproteobacteria bacterium]|nr:hypothetical protein [Deltaproteobacteria bacterium]